MPSGLGVFFGTTLLLAVLQILILCGYYAYQITPRELYDMRKWDNTTYEKTAKVCNAAPYDIKTTIAYPLHEKQYGLELVPELNFQALIDAVKAGQFELFFKDIFDRAVLNHTRDYTTLQLSPEQIIKPGDCHTLQAKFRQGRERFFVRSQPADNTEAVAINQEVKRFITTSNVVTDQTDIKTSKKLTWLNSNRSDLRLYADIDNDRLLTSKEIPKCNRYQDEFSWWMSLNVMGGVLFHPNIVLSSKPSRKGLTKFDRFISVSKMHHIPFDCMKVNTESEFIAVFEAPGVSLVAVDKDKRMTNLSEALENARHLRAMIENRRWNLARAQHKQQEFQEQYKPPYAILFGRLDDPNGYTEEGIFVRDMPDQDLYGEPRTLPTGVWIAAINNYEVFGVADFMHELYRHALSFSEGIEKKLSITYYDGTEYKQTSARFFFNPDAFKDKERFTGMAVRHGIVDALTFGNSGEAECLAADALAGFFNLVYILTDDKTRAKYVDKDACLWEQNTQKAMAKQFKSDLYNNSSFVAVFLPMPSLFRSIAGKPIQRGVGSALGRGRVAGAVSNIIIETAEAVAYDIGTAPPDTPFKTRLAKVVQAGTPVFAATTAGVMQLIVSKH